MSFGQYKYRSPTHTLWPSVLALNPLSRHLEGVISNLLFVLVSFGMGGISFDYFGDFYQWFLLCLLTFESFFAMIAAVAASMPLVAGLQTLQKVPPSPRWAWRGAIFTPELVPVHHRESIPTPCPRHLYHLRDE